MTATTPSLSATEPQRDPPWHAQEQLLMSEVIGLIGKSLAPSVVLREMLHLMSELLGLNRGRAVRRCCLFNALDSLPMTSHGNTRQCVGGLMVCANTPHRFESHPF